MVFVREGRIFRNQPDRLQTDTENAQNVLSSSAMQNTSEPSSLYASGYGSFQDCDLLLPPGPTGDHESGLQF